MLSLLTHCLRGPGWCQSICLWSVMLRKRCTAPTLHSTTLACLKAATTAASSFTQIPPGLHQREVAAPLKPLATSPSSWTRHPQHHQKATSRLAVRAAHRLVLLQGVTKCPSNLLATPPHTPFLGRIPHILKARYFPWPCLHRLYFLLTITHTCTWAPPPVRKREH